MPGGEQIIFNKRFQVLFAHATALSRKIYCQKNGVSTYLNFE